MNADGYVLTFRWAVVYFLTASRREDALRKGNVVLEAVIHGVPEDVDASKLRKVLMASAHADRFSDHGRFLVHRRIVQFESLSTKSDERHRKDLHWEELL